MFPFINIIDQPISATRIVWRDGVREPLLLYNTFKIYNFENREISGSIATTSDGNMDISSQNDIRIFAQALNLPNQTKIAFNSDSTNTYIAANTDNPEDLEIHADQDILLKPDSSVKIFNDTTNWASFFGSSKVLQLKNSINGDYSAFYIWNADSTNNADGKASIDYYLGTTAGTAVHSGKVQVKKEQIISQATDTKNTSMSFHTCQNGTLAEKMTLSSAGNLSLTGDITLTGQSKIAFHGDSTNTYIAATPATSPEDLEIHADFDLNLIPDRNLNIYAGSTHYATFDSGMQALRMHDQSKIIFDSTTTYIAANTDDPEDLLIHADQDILLKPDADVRIHTGGTEYGTFLGNGKKLELFNVINGDYQPIQLWNKSGDATGKVSLNYYLGDNDDPSNGIHSGKILVGKEQLFTTTDSTQNSSMEFHLSRGGTLASKMSLSSLGLLTTNQVNASTLSATNITATGTVILDGVTNLSGQPAFQAAVGDSTNGSNTDDMLVSTLALDSSETAEGASHLDLNRRKKIPFGNQRFDIGSNYNPNSGIFVAPNSGKYLFTVSVYLHNLDVDANYILVELMTSNRNYRIGILGDIDEFAYRTDPAVEQIKYLVFSGTVLADMDADDNARVAVLQNGGAYSQLKIVGRDNSSMSYFSGYKAL